MKVMFVGNSFPTATDPCTVWMKRIADQLSNEGHDVVVVATHGIASSYIGRAIQYAALYWKIFWSSLKNVDVIYIHHPSHSYLPFLFRGIAGCRLVVNLHGNDLVNSGADNLKFRLLRSVSLRACKDADLIVVPSKYFESRLHSLLPGCCTLVSPSGGVDFRIFYPMTNGSSSNRSTLRIVCVSHLFKEKGIGTLLEALRGCILNFECDIVGGGPDRTRLETLSRDYGLCDKIRFHGPVAAVDVPKFLRSADVFVFPTERQSESLGLVALEAMACGLPVIGTRIGAVPEYVQHGKNGFIFEVGNSDELRGCLLQFAGLSASDRARFRESALETAELYESGKTTRKLGYAIESIVDKSAARGVVASRRRNRDVA